MSKKGVEKGASEEELGASEEELVFPPYNALQLQKIPEQREIFLKDLPNCTSEEHANLQEVIEQIITLDKLGKEPIELYINSLGGYVVEAMALCDLIKAITSPVVTICVGHAYSAAALILSSGKIGMRYITPHSKVMIHGASMYAGKDSHITKEECKHFACEIATSNKNILTILASNTGESIKSLADYFNNFKEDVYLSPKEAKKLGIVDKILSDYAKFEKDIERLNKK